MNTYCFSFPNEIAFVAVISKCEKTINAQILFLESESLDKGRNFMKQVESIYLLRQCGTLTVQAPHSGKHFEKKSLGSEAAVRRFTSK